MMATYYKPTERRGKHIGSDQLTPMNRNATRYGS